MRSIALLFTAASVWGCATPVKVQKTAKKVGTLAPTPQPAAALSRKKSFIVLGTQSLPNEDALENAFAKQTVVVDVGPSPEGTQLSLPGVVCTVSSSEKPTDTPKAILPESCEPHGLSAAEAKQLASTSTFFKISCLPDEQQDSRGLMPLAELAVSTIADVTSGWIADIDTGRYWPREAWATARSKSPKYTPGRAYRIIVEQPDAQQPALVYTKGLIAFGRSEIGLYPVEANMVDRVAATLPFIADLSLDEKPLAAGHTLSYTDEDSFLVDAKTYLRHFVSGPNEPHVRDLLILSKPDFDVGDRDAYRAYVMRLVAQ